MNIAIIYHDADFDGKLSNEVCRHHLEREFQNANIHSYGWDYGRPTPLPSALPSEQADQAFRSEDDWARYDEIFIVDLSVDALMSRPELFNKITWIDHHKSAIQKWDTRESLFRGMRIDGVAACRLCWAYFTWDEGQEFIPPLTKDIFVNREIYEPHLIRLAGEYDIWDHRDPDAKALQFGLRTLNDHDFAQLIRNQFHGVPTGTELNDVVAHGHAIKSYCDKQNYEYSATFSRTLNWEGLSFCCLNIGQRGNSDLLLGGIKPHHDACFAWRDDGRAVTVSLYHIAGKTDIDLSLIAVKYGGGGHRGACGFKLSLAELAKILSC